MQTETSERARAKRVVLAYPVLLGLYPLLHLYATNADRMPVRYVALPAGACFLAILILLFLFRFLTKNPAKAALAVTIFAAFFFSYGRVRTLLQWLAGRFPALTPVSNHAVLWPLFVALLVVAIVLILRSRRNFQILSAPLNVFAVALTGLALLPIPSHLSRQPSRNEAVHLTLPPQAPDVYYIILDAYGRDDVLREHFGFDNSDFLDGLRKRGFTVAEQSRSNYLYTSLSLSSSLNLDYFDGLRPPSQPNTRDWLTKQFPIYDLIEFSRVAKSFKAAGYQFVDLPSGISMTNRSRLADVNYASPYSLWEFNSLFQQTTMLAPWLSDQFDQVSPPELQRMEDVLVRASSIPGPKFVFAHFLSPHPPYQFRANGSLAPHAPAGVIFEWGNHAAYIEAVRYLNSFVLRAVDELVKNSKVQPVIILQGDHGPALRDDTVTQNSLEPWNDTFWNARSAILNAYLVPPSIAKKIPQDVTPVNSFRILFRELYGADLPLLENQTWYCNRADVFRFFPVPQTALITNPQLRE